MKTKKLIRFIEEPAKLNELDMNQIRGGLGQPRGDCNCNACNGTNNCNQTNSSNLFIN